MKIIIKNNLLVLTIFVICFISCNSNGIEQDLKSWYNSVVHVPMDSMVYLSNKPYDFYTKAEFIYVIYVDSTSCSDCAIKHLSDWSVFDASEKYGNERLKYFFVIAPKPNQYKHILDVVRGDTCFNEFTFVDTLNIFERKNPNLPKNKLLHTFLINKEGRVMLVGNPITNPKIGSMLSEIISSSRDSQQSI